MGSRLPLIRDSLLRVAINTGSRQTSSFPLNSDKVSCWRTVILVVPVLARLVVTIITPLAPRDPYIALADASLSTSILTISAGFICFRSPASPKGNPSTTTRGALDPFNELPPRIRTVDDAPGSCDELTTCKPAARPCSKLSTELAGISCNLSIFTVATEPVRSLFFTLP